MTSDMNSLGDGKWLAFRLFLQRWSERLLIILSQTTWERTDTPWIKTDLVFQVLFKSLEPISFPSSPRWLVLFGKTKVLRERHPVRLSQTHFRERTEFSKKEIKRHILKTKCYTIMRQKNTISLFYHRTGECSRKCCLLSLETTHVLKPTEKKETWQTGIAASLPPCAFAQSDPTYHAMFLGNIAVVMQFSVLRWANRISAPTTLVGRREGFLKIIIVL